MKDSHLQFIMNLFILETDVQTFEPFCLLLACLFESHTHCELVFDKTIFVKEMFLDALASLKTMLDIHSVIDVFKISTLQSITECYRVLQSITAC